ncbi:alpha-amylase [Pendulispora brunnea]|uniref:Alpha-amylase n=1 Tax=Pendulispora brunnea TaxID=2905690 RepID=A0ABZ2KSL3_9BACT
MHGVMFQFFEWNLPNDGSLWRTIAESAPSLREKGITAIWFPPATKGAAGGYDVGYAVYDLFDLGEFDQKNSTRTKYGTREELLRAVEAVQAHGMDAYLDVVMNHRIGGDETEEVTVVEVNPANRLEAISEPYVIRAWSHYTFPGRAGAYSDFQWTRDHFDAFGADANQPEVSGKIFRVADRAFSSEVDPENGNFAYLMGANVDHSRQDVRDELVRWGVWLLETTGARGVRIDAAKHISRSFVLEWLTRVREAHPEREVFAVGEYWSGSIDMLESYLRETKGALRLFDVPLHFRMHQASQLGRDYDLRTLLDDTLVARNPMAAVTFVDNHDSQPGQALASPIADWFKPIAYAFILLRHEGYPCVFYGDYFGNDGAGGDDQRLVAHRHVIDAMLVARAKFLYGEQEDYFESPTCVGWIVRGNDEHPGIMAVVVSTADACVLTMQAGRPAVEFREITGASEDRLRAGDDGAVRFHGRAGGVSVWCSV